MKERYIHSFFPFARIFGLLLGCMLIAPVLFAQSTPPPPELENVSIMWSSQPPEYSVRIMWTQAEGDYYVRSFNIYRWDDLNGNVLIGTQNNGDNSVWIDNNAPANVQRCIYTVSLLYRETVFGEMFETAVSEERFQTILLDNQVDYDPCAKTNTIRFNEYMIYGQTSAYELWVSVDDGFWEYLGDAVTSDLTIVDSVPTGGAGVLVDHKTNIYSYTFENIEPDKSYRYRVSAKLGGFDDFSLSTTSEVFSPSYPLPQKPSIQSVSVQQDGSILINADVLDTQLCQSVYYNRYINPGETPVIIQEDLPVAGTSVSTSDNEVESSANSYFYEIAVTDQCGFPLAASEVHRSILLEGEIETQNTVTLNWNSYEGWIVTGQELYRSFNGVETLLATLTAFTETYQDNTIGPLAAAGGVLWYYVKAINNDDSGRYSNSNIVSFTFDVEPLLPNAFNPYSTEIMNSSFKPVQTYLNASGYQLQVYHRWGGLIWETNNPNEGWDGRNKNGKLLPRGTYAYLLLYQNAAGIGQQKRGTITMIY